MRENPDLDQLKRQAKELLEAYRASVAGSRRRGHGLSPHRHARELCAA